MRYAWLNDYCVNLEGPPLRLEDADQQTILSLGLDCDELFLLLDPVDIQPTSESESKYKTQKTLEKRNSLPSQPTPPPLASGSYQSNS